MTFQQFIQHLLNNWLPQATILEQNGHGAAGGYTVQTAVTIPFTIGNQNYILDTQSKTTALQIFCQHMSNTPNPPVVVGTASQPQAPYNNAANATVWFGGNPPAGAQVVGQYWRIKGVYIRPA